jgi:WD40 repeat protein
MHLLLKKYIKEVIYNIYLINIELGGGIGIIEMLKRSNILALVGGGILPKFSKNKITIWDDHLGKVVSQIRFNSNLIKVRIREDCIIGILIDKIAIININTLETIDILETFNNPNGIFSLSYIINKLHIAFPQAKLKGKVKIEEYFAFNNNFRKNEENKVISAHESNIANITMNNNGTLLATASDKGTLIRLFNISTKEIITELRRGAKNVKINCIAFDSNNNFLGCSSDGLTVHIFDIHEVNKVIEKSEEKNQENDENKKEENNKKDDNIKKEKVKFGKSFGLIKINERSFAKLKVIEEKTILGFCEKNSIIVLSSDGNYYKASYDIKHGGFCKKTEENKIEII